MDSWVQTRNIMHFFEFMISWKPALIRRGGSVQQKDTVAMLIA